MTTHLFTFNPFQTNCYVCHDAGEAVVIDPGCYYEAERRLLLQYLDEHHLTVRRLLLTHAHIDHIFDCAYFSRRFGLSFQMHREDLPLLQHAQEQAAMFGVDIETPPLPDTFLAEGDTVTFGSVAWRVLHAPGHSPGSICFYDEVHREVIAGDVLFAGSIGRTDLWQGSLPQLLRSIYDKLMTLDDDVTVYPGHGPATTIGRERSGNPFLTDP